MSLEGSSREEYYDTFAILRYKQKIKEFKLILEQELNNGDNYLVVKQKLNTLLEVYKEHFQNELK